MSCSYVKVAFFDSGIGGLTTLNACVNYAKENLSDSSNFHFYYYGDNFRAPYGNLSYAQIDAYVDEAFSFFVSLKVDAVVLACNTATAVCAERLRKKYSFPIVGIEPAIFSAIKNIPNPNGEVWALTTRATFLSDRFNCLCARARKKFPRVTLRAMPCDRLAGEIEKNLEERAYDYTPLLPLGTPSAVVLGCTHYVYVKEQIERFYSCPVFDGNDGVARRLFSLLKECGQHEWLFSGENVDNVNLPFRGKVFHSVVDNCGGKGNKEEFFWSEREKESHKRRKRDFFEISKKTCISKPLVTTLPKKSNIPKISFVGNARMVNKTKYEQMFAQK